MARAASEQRVEDEGFLGNGIAAAALARARSSWCRHDVLHELLLLVRLIVGCVERSLLRQRGRRRRNWPGRHLAGGSSRGIRRWLKGAASAAAGEPQRQNGRRETDEQGASSGGEGFERHQELRSAAHINTS